MTAPGSRIKDGISFREKERAGSCYRLVLLNIKPGTAMAAAGKAIEALWAMLQELRAEIVADIKSAQPAEEIKDARDPDPHLRCLVGFGSKLFTRYSKLTRPPGVWPLGENPFPKLQRVDSDRRTGEADLALQLTANTNLAVDRALVEVWMLTQQQRPLPLEIVTFYSGFNREDRR